MKMHQLATFAIWASLVAGCSTSPMRDDAAAGEALRAQAAAWDRAIVAKDAAGVAANMTSDFQQIASDGARHDRQEFLGSILSPKLRIDPYPVDDLEVDIDGNVAFLRGRTRMTGSYDGHPFTTEYRYLDVYLYRDGQWRVRHVQTTPVSP